MAKDKRRTPGAAVVATNGNGTRNVTLAREEQLAILADIVTERLTFARQHGLQYADDRDIYKVAGYPNEIPFKKLHATYERDALAGRIVDMAAETTWRASAGGLMPDVTDRPDNAASDADTDFMVAWQALSKQLRIWNRLERVDKLARIGQFAVLVVGTVNDTDQTMGQPIASVGERGPAGVTYLQPYAQGSVTIADWETDTRDPRFGLPKSYTIKLSGGVQGFPARSLTVHHSRVIHVAEGLLQDDVYGRPVLQRVFNDLHDLLKVRASSAEAYWQVIAGILQANVDPTANIGETQMDALDEDLQKLYHDLKRTFVGQGVEISRVGGEPPDPKGSADLYLKLIATGTEYPMRVLIGNETGERASTEDMKAYYGTIAERRINHAEPNILRPLIDLLVGINALPRPAGGEYTVVWPSLFQESEKDQAEANRQRAEAAKALTPVGGNPVDLVEIDDERNVWLRPTGERGQLTPEDLEPPEPEPDDDIEPGAEPPAPAGGAAEEE